VFFLFHDEKEASFSVALPLSQTVFELNLRYETKYHLKREKLS